MYKFKTSVIAIFGLLALMCATSALLPETGFGQSAGGPDCDGSPCDAVERGREAFNNPARRSDHRAGWHHADLAARNTARSDNGSGSKRPEPPGWLPVGCALQYSPGTGARRVLRARAGDGGTLSPDAR